MRYIVSGILVLIVLFSGSGLVRADCIPGDAYADGVVNMGDVTKLERIILGLDSETPCADANEDGSVDMGDIIYLERKILGLVP